MKTLLRRLFLEHWHRKLLSLILAVIIWLIINHQMTVTKHIHNIPVRVENLPIEKTIENMQVNGILNKRITLTITANKSVMDELTGKDLEVVIDARGKPDQWIATINKKNLVSLNSDIDINKAISRVVPYDLIIKQSKLITDKIPILVSQPIGEAPKGYQYIGIYPYRLHVTVTGPEETVKRLKARGQKLTFNLSDLTRSELDALLTNNRKENSDEVSFFVPNSWKKISLPILSDTPVEIDDPQAKDLRIDFSHQDLIPIGVPIPISIYFPPKSSQTLNPDTYTLATNQFVVKKNGIKVITQPLYAQGVSKLFVDIVKDMLHIFLIAAPKNERETLLWNCQFAYPHELEDRYVAKVMSECHEDGGEVQPYAREEHLRNRFRNYMNRFRLYTAKNQKLNLKIELQANTITVQPQDL